MSLQNGYISPSPAALGTPTGVIDPVTGVTWTLDAWKSQDQVTGLFMYNCAVLYLVEGQWQVVKWIYSLAAVTSPDSIFVVPAGSSHAGANIQTFSDLLMVYGSLTAVLADFHASAMAQLASALAAQAPLQAGETIAQADQQRMAEAIFNQQPGADGRSWGPKASPPYLGSP